jgi:hypothetical protein
MTKQEESVGALSCIPEVRNYIPFVSIADSGRLLSLL